MEMNHIQKAQSINSNNKLKNTMKKFILLLLSLLYGSATSADAIDMRDYIMLRSDMTEAEVLYKFGPPDHETYQSDSYDYVITKTWYYIPERKGSNKWITEIKFNSNGRIIDHDRSRIK
jgi:outer membrane protein assembly factor BamE (lipoprotein component of BamABCDE complex)